MISEYRNAQGPSFWLTIGLSSSLQCDLTSGSPPVCLHHVCNAAVCKGRGTVTSPVSVYWLDIVNTTTMVVFFKALGLWDFFVVICFFLGEGQLPSEDFLKIYLMWLFVYFVFHLYLTRKWYWGLKTSFSRETLPRRADQWKHIERSNHRASST